MYSERRNSLPNAPRIDLDDSSIHSLGASSLPCCVLIVDDDPQVVRRISSLLRSDGYVVHSAGSGEDALRLLDQTICQIVLTDWHMPDMDGLALCRNLRQRQSEGYIYILMLTVRDSPDDILVGLAAGADDYVVKGAAPEEILARLEVGRRITHLERSLRKSNDENRRMSITDALTGVHNRRFLMKYLPRELERSRRYNHPLAVISCDLDNFKRINDSFGHEAGDEILQAFATRASDCIRQGLDWVARTGGEEFIIVLPETNLRSASCAADRVRRLLAAHPIATSSGPLAVTVSMGVTAVETAQERISVSVRALLRAADRCLYSSKHHGKDRATVASIGIASQLLMTDMGAGHATH
jgi:two-component system, cell cycle response regulator